MKRNLQGKYIISNTAGEEVKAFVPNSLSPNPAIEWSINLKNKYDKAMYDLGRLDAMSTELPNTDLFLYMYVKKEAILSSKIEGTQSSLLDLLLFEMDQITTVPIDDVTEVSNYVNALNYGIEKVQNGFPISLRLIKDIHAILLKKGRGSKQTPGEFRRSQNWIGGTRLGNADFVPPPANYVLDTMSKLKLFINNKPEATQPLLKSALSHVQFETIHPFLDGNGRLGRLLITLILFSENILATPMLYLSLYFKTHRTYYYELLNETRYSGDWEKWIDFFVDAVITISKQAVSTIRKITKLQGIDKNKIISLGRGSESALMIFHSLFKNPITTSKHLVNEIGLTPITVNKALKNLENLGIITEITNQKRNRVYSYSGYLKIVNEGIE